VSDEQTPQDERSVEAAEVQFIIDSAMQNDDAIGFLARMQSGVFEASGLDARTYLLVRLAAGVATGMGTTSWKVHEELFNAFEVDPREVLGTLVAIAPVVGAPRFLAAMDHVTAD